MSLQTPPPMPPPVVQPPAAPKARDSREVEPDLVGENTRVDAGMISDGRAPSWLISCIVHAIALILLAFFSLSAKQKPSGQILVSIAKERAIEPVRVAPIQDQKFEPIDTMQAAVDVQQLHRANVPIAKLQESQTSVAQEAPEAFLALLQGELSGAATSGNLHLPGKGGFEGREDGRRQQLADKYGGTPESEAAVGRTLEWLAAHQHNNGSWDFDLSKGPCGNKCRNARNNPSDQATPKTAATGLALLPFLGAGHTHTRGKYARVVSRGIYYLRGKMRDAKVGKDLQYGNMYGHGIATLVIAEAYAMTDDQDLRDTLIELRKFIVAAQHEKGGWRYRPGQPGDMPVTGWQILALKSCALGGLPIPTSTAHSAREFLDSLSEQEGSRFGYLSAGEKPTPTAIGLLLSMYLGKPRGDQAILDGCDYLFQLGPSPTDVYFNYYATMTLHHARYYAFPAWNQRIQKHLLSTQSRQGHEAGSWHFKDQYGSVGGRLYTTVMCALVLETYYRHLPLWEEGEFPL